MAQIISGIGLQIQLVSTVTFPNGGFIITQFADDTDPLDVPSMQIGDGEIAFANTLPTVKLLGWNIPIFSNRVISRAEIWARGKSRV